ncbi:MAG: HD-GYP domain-containing protein [Ruminiclostridium sp.]
MNTGTRVPAIKVKVDELESGMITADAVKEPGSDHVLLLENTTLDSVMIFNLKERYHVEEIWVKCGVKSEDIKVEIDVNESLNTLKNIFGDDDSQPISELTREASENVGAMADQLISSLYSDDNILLKMHQLQTYDDYTYKHCLRVAMMAVTIGNKLNLDKKTLRDLCEAALLHDIGKRTIDVNIIRKPDKLTDNEFDEIKKHPANGYFLLKNNGNYSNEVMNAVLMHQEKYDGSGYPLKLKGDNISYLARIITVADVYDALTSNRPYRQPWSVAEAEEFMMGGSGTHFDYDIVVAFLAAFAPYPVGDKVVISDGRNATIVSNNTNVLRPVIKVDDTGEIIDLYNDFKSLTLTIKKRDKNMMGQ